MHVILSTKATVVPHAMDLLVMRMGAVSFRAQIDVPAVDIYGRSRWWDIAWPQ